jgi:integrase
MRATPVMANRVLFLVSTLFNLAERWGLRGEGTNPCRHIPRYREHKRERFLTDAELERLGRALAEVEQAPDAIHAALAAIRLLALTGARRGEVLGLRWDHVDLACRVLRLPDSKTGAKVILLDDSAAELLAGLRREGPWVFPSKTHRGIPLRDIRKTWRRVLERADLSGLRLHDLRHTHASVGAEAGLSLSLIGALLGHRRAATTERYAHLVDDAQRAAVRLVQGRIALAWTAARRPRCFRSGAEACEPTADRASDRSQSSASLRESAGRDALAGVRGLHDPNEVVPCFSDSDRLSPRK